MTVPALLPLTGGRFGSDTWHGLGRTSGRFQRNTQLQKRSPCKYYKDKNGYPINKHTGKPKHREVLEKKFNHPLSEGSVVHHKNRDKTDNRPENLWVFRSQTAHFKAHLKDKKRFGSW